MQRERAVVARSAVGKPARYPDDNSGVNTRSACEQTVFGRLHVIFAKALSFSYPVPFNVSCFRAKLYHGPNCVCASRCPAAPASNRRWRGFLCAVEWAGMWVSIAILSCVCGYAYLAAIIPSWSMRWGGRGKGPPMSTVGRLAFGTLSGYLAMLFMIDPAPRFRVPLIAVYVLMLIGMIPIYLRDLRNSKASTSTRLRGK